MFGQWPIRIVMWQLILSHKHYAKTTLWANLCLSSLLPFPQFFLPPLSHFSLLPFPPSSDFLLPPLSVQLMAGKPAGAGGSQLWERGGGGSSVCRCRGRTDSGDTGNRETLRDTQGHSGTPRRYPRNIWVGGERGRHLFEKISILDTGTPFNLIWVCKLKRGWGQWLVFFIIFCLLHMFSLLCLVCFVYLPKGIYRRTGCFCMFTWKRACTW